MQMRSSSYLLLDGTYYWEGGKFGGYAAIYIDIENHKFYGVAERVHNAYLSQNCELQTLKIGSKYANGWLETYKLKILSDCSRIVDLHNELGAP